MNAKRSLLLLFLCTICATTLQAQRVVDEFSMDQTYPISETGTFELHSDDAEVTIRATNRTDVHLKVDYKRIVQGINTYKGPKISMDVTERGGNVIAREKSERQNSSNWSFTIGSIETEYTIVVEVPLSVDLKLRGDDDTYRLTDIGGGINIKADDANILMNGCTGFDFYIKADDADIVMDRGRGSLTLDADDSDLRVDQAEFDRMMVRGDDLELDLRLSVPNNADYEFDFDDGSLDIRFLSGGGTIEIFHDNIRLVTSSDFKTLNDRDHYKELQLGEGSAAIAIDVDDAHIKLDG